IVNGLTFTPPAKPGDDLLFHCLGSSTIGAVRFHGRVRDGIGWVTDAMVTKLWSRRAKGSFRSKLRWVPVQDLEIDYFIWPSPCHDRIVSNPDNDGGTLKRE